MIYVRQQQRNEEGRERILKGIGIAALCVVLFALWKTGTLTSIRRWVSGEYRGGATAIEQSQQNFGAGMAQNRERQQEREMGGKQ